MIFTIKEGIKTYATVNYEKGAFKILEASDRNRKELQASLDIGFAVYDPRPGMSGKKQPHDKFSAWLCLEQAIYNTRADEVEFEGDLDGGTFPSDIPGIVY